MKLKEIIIKLRDLGYTGADIANFLAIFYKDLRTHKSINKKNMKTDIATTTNKLINFDTEEIDLIKNRIASKSTDIEFKFFLYDSQARGLNPLKNQIYWIQRAGKATHQVGIDGYRVIAQRTGEYQGQTKVEYGQDENGKFAEVGIWRKKFKEPVVGRAYLNEYIQATNPLWKKMPMAMLAKCAESLALRKAFPDELSGLYTNEEMAQADNQEFVEVKAGTVTGEIVTPKMAKEIFEAPAKISPERDKLNKAFWATWAEFCSLKQWKDKELQDFLIINFLVLIFLLPECRLILFSF